MKTKVALLLICLLLMNCRSREKAIQSEKEKITEKVEADTNIVVSEEKKIIQAESETKKSEQKEKDNSGDIVITGKTESEKDFHYHNVVNGDTISDILIKGNADFVIKNRWQQTEKKVEEQTEKNSLNIIAQIARKSVAQSTIKEAAKEIKKVEKEIESKGFVFPIYIIFGIGFLLLVLLFFFWKKFGGDIWERLNRRR